MKTTTLAISALASAGFVTAVFSPQQQGDFAVEVIQEAGNANRYTSVGSTCALVSVDENENFDCEDRNLVTCNGGPCAYSGLSNSTQSFYTLCDGYSGTFWKYTAPGGVTQAQACDCQQVCSNVNPVINAIVASVNNNGPTSTPITSTPITSTPITSTPITSTPITTHSSSSGFSSSTPTPTPSPSHTSFPVAAVAGGVVGGLVLLALIGGLIACCVVRSKKRQAAAAAMRYSQQSQPYSQGYYSPGSVKHEFVA